MNYTIFLFYFVKSMIWCDLQNEFKNKVDKIKTCKIKIVFPVVVIDDIENRYMYKSDCGDIIISNKKYKIGDTIK